MDGSRSLLQSSRGEIMKNQSRMEGIEEVKSGQIMDIFHE